METLGDRLVADKQGTNLPGLVWWLGWQGKRKKKIKNKIKWEIKKEKLQPRLSVLTSGTRVCVVSACAQARCLFSNDVAKRGAKHCQIILLGLTLYLFAWSHFRVW